MFECDELRVYRGHKEIKINNNIVVTIPTLDQIEEFGEKRYFNAVHNLTSVGADLKWQLWDLGIDYTKIEDYDLFIKLVSQLVSSKKKLYTDMIEHPEKYDNQLDEDELSDLLINPIQLVLKERLSYKKLLNEIMGNYEKSGLYIDNYGNEYDTEIIKELSENSNAILLRDMDFVDFKPFVLNSNNQIVLYNQKSDITFDRLAYAKSIEIIRKIHGFKRNNQIPANERTKMDLIEDARDEAMLASKKPFKSVLLPLLSTLQVKCGQCGDEKIWDMPISAFFENVKRIGKIQEAQLLLQGAYSGFANLKGVDKSRLDMFGDI